MKTFLEELHALRAENADLRRKTLLNVYDTLVVRNARESRSKLEHILAANVHHNGGEIRVPVSAIHAELGRELRFYTDHATNTLIVRVG